MPLPQDREEQQKSWEGKCKKRLDFFRMLEDGIGLKEYVHEPMDAAAKLKLNFRRGRC